MEPHRNGTVRRTVEILLSQGRRTITRAPDVDHLVPSGLGAACANQSNTHREPHGQGRSVLIGRTHTVSHGPRWNHTRYMGHAQVKHAPGSYNKGWGALSHERYMGQAQAHHAPERGCQVDWPYPVKWWRNFTVDGVLNTACKPSINETACQLFFSFGFEACFAPSTQHPEGAGMQNPSQISMLAPF